MTPKRTPPSIHMTKAAMARDTEIGQASLIMDGDRGAGRLGVAQARRVAAATICSGAALRSSSSSGNSTAGEDALGELDPLHGHGLVVAERLPVCSFSAGEQFLPQAKSSGLTGEAKKSTKVTMLITISMMTPMNTSPHDVCGHG